MTNNNAPKDQEQLAQQIFCTKDAYKSLTKIARAPKESDDFTVVFNDIVQLVKGNNQVDFVERVPQLIKKINSDISLRKSYLQLIKQLQFAESGRQAAASSKELLHDDGHDKAHESEQSRLTDRQTEYFSLKFKRDQNHPSQVYVILTIMNPTESHLNSAIALHITTDSQADCLYFPLLIDGRSQLLMDDDDEQFKLLSDDNSHLHLM